MSGAKREWGLELEGKDCVRRAGCDGSPVEERRLLYQKGWYRRKLRGSCTCQKIGILFHSKVVSLCLLKHCADLHFAKFKGLYGEFFL